jgi:hypothetical protein
LISQPMSAIAAQMTRLVSKLPCATNYPPTNDPSAMPRNSELLFHASRNAD